MVPISSPEGRLPLGVGLDFGLAFAGHVGSGEVKDFTALGDVVNTAARLQSEAKPPPRSEAIRPNRVRGRSQAHLASTWVPCLGYHPLNEPIICHLTS